jgi:hypothetical protein
MESRQKVAMNDVVDVEMNTPSSISNAMRASSVSQSLHGKPSWWEKVISWGVEERGVTPVPVKERTDDRFINIFFLWFTMSISTLPYALFPNSIIMNLR